MNATADAKPAKGWIFAGWEGSVVSNSKRVPFIMEEGAALTATFVENPCAEIAGDYRAGEERGLFRAIHHRWEKAAAQRGV